jgi:lipopolysaccharide/colanic/teichoic acid biosynthesis glycosyltransferase
MKRVFDVIVAAITLVVASPIMLAAAIAILIESGTPIFFRQERIGAEGRPFSIFKFRTMRGDAGSQWARPGDDRITRVGALLRRTSIDELPQLFNVLRGEMSIVGPRPEMVDFAASFAGTIPNYEQRHVVAPGITGWAQVYCKRNLQPVDMTDVLPFDLFYVEHASVALDAAIVLKTAAEVVFHRAV